MIREDYKDDLYLADATARMASSFPEWSRLRQVAYSSGQILLNSIGPAFDELSWQVRNLQANVLPSTFNSRELDILRVLDLPSNFEFRQRYFDGADVRYAPPVVTGVIGSDEYPVDSTYENTIESLWYLSLPNRITVTYVPTVSDAILYSDIDLLSFKIDETVKIPAIQSNLFVSARDIENVAYRTATGEIDFVEVRIFGYDTNGSETEEAVKIKQDAVLKTKNKWAKIEKVSVTPPGNGNIDIALYPMQGIPVQLADRIRVGRTDQDVWLTVAEDNYTTKLRFSHMANDGTENLAANMFTVVPHKILELADTSGDLVTGVECVASDTFSSRCYAASADTLYVFDRRMPDFDNLDLMEQSPEVFSGLSFTNTPVDRSTFFMSTVSAVSSDSFQLQENPAGNWQSYGLVVDGVCYLITGNNDNNITVATTSGPAPDVLDGTTSRFVGKTAYIVGTEIDIDCVYLRKVAIPLRWRWSFYDKDRTLRYLASDGTWISDPDSAWSSNQLGSTKDMPRNSLAFVIGQTGTSIVRLEIDYYLDDGTIITDLLIAAFNVTVAKALCEHELSLLAEPKGLWFHDDGTLKLIDVNDNIYSIVEHKDIMLIDYDNKKIYLHEEYDEVVVTP